MQKPVSCAYSLQTASISAKPAIVARDNAFTVTSLPTHAIVKNKTLTTWLALLAGQTGAHRLYLHGWRDALAWLHPVLALLGWWGIYRIAQHGHNDVLAWFLAPLLGVVLAICGYSAIFFGLMAAEKWNARHNSHQGDLEHRAGRSNGLTVVGVLAGLLFGTIAFMATLAYSFQRYFEFAASAIT
jgi:hypothetical protein